jgi:hypothetical protein
MSNMNIKSIIVEQYSEKKIREEMHFLIRTHSLSSSEHFLSLEQIYLWLNESEQYKKYINDAEFRERYNIVILRNPIHLLTEFSSYYDNKDDNKDIANECDFTMKNTNGIKVPWFNAGGLKALCMVINTRNTIYLCKLYNQIENRYYRTVQKSETKDRCTINDLTRKLTTTKTRLTKVIDEQKKYRLKRAKEQLELDKEHDEIYQERLELDKFINSLHSYLIKITKYRDDIKNEKTKLNRDRKALNKVQDELNAYRNGSDIYRNEMYSMHSMIDQWHQIIEEYRNELNNCRDENLLAKQLIEQFAQFKDSLNGLTMNGITMDDIIDINYNDV